jgi:predicted secreted hydrolase
MLYQMRRDDGSIDPFSSGTYVNASGEPRRLSLLDFRVLPGSTWRSERTGAQYPLRWRIELPSLDLVLDVEPALNEQEMVTQATTGISYWEGSITITGSRGRQPVEGQGYLELTGYVGKGLGSLLDD